MDKRVTIMHQLLSDRLGDEKFKEIRRLHMQSPLARHCQILVTLDRLGRIVNQCNRLTYSELCMLTYIIATNATLDYDWVAATYSNNMWCKYAPYDNFVIIRRAGVRDAM